MSCSVVHFSKFGPDGHSYQTKIRLASLIDNKKVWSSYWTHCSEHDSLLTNDYFVYVGYTEDDVVQIVQVDLETDQVSDQVDRLDVPECIWKETPEYRIRDPTIKASSGHFALIMYRTYAVLRCTKRLSRS